MKKLRSLTWAIIPLAVLVMGGIAVGLQPERSAAWLEKMQNQLGITIKSDNVELTPEQLLKAIAEGNEIVRQSRLLLLHHETPLSADLLQIIQTPSESYRATGTYAQASNSRSRLELRMEIEGITGRMLNVTNGQVSWSVRDIYDPETAPQSEDGIESGYRKLDIQRVDLQRLAEYGQLMNVPPLDANLGRELQGGMPGLLATLEAEMDFRVKRRVSLQGQRCFVLEGTWKKATSETPQEQQRPPIFFAASPDLVRLFIRENDLLPVRYLCLKKHPDRSGYYAPLAMELSNIQFDTQINLAQFQYQPPEDQIANDITHQYLARLQHYFSPSVQTTEAPAETISQ